MPEPLGGQQPATTTAALLQYLFNNPGIAPVLAAPRYHPRFPALSRITAPSILPSRARGTGGLTQPAMGGSAALHPVDRQSQIDSQFEQARMRYEYQRAAIEQIQKEMQQLYGLPQPTGLIPQATTPTPQRLIQSDVDQAKGVLDQESGTLPPPDIPESTEPEPTTAPEKPPGQEIPPPTPTPMPMPTAPVSYIIPNVQQLGTFESYPAWYQQMMINQQYPSWASYFTA